MKPDKLDIKIQEAAAHNEPAHNQREWDAMEKLLDEEMPQQKKDTKKIFWIFLLLFLITGLLLINYPYKNKEEAMLSLSRDSDATSAETRDSTESYLAGTNNKIQSQAGTNNLISQNPTQKITSQTQVQELIKEGKTNNQVIDDKNKIAQDKKNIPANFNFEERSKPLQSYPSQNLLVDSNNDIAGAKKNNYLQKENNQIPSHKKNSTSKTRNQFSNSFSLSFSAGPDVSGVGFGDIGKTNFNYGAGLSYQIHKKFAIRTGFFVEKKVYDAEASDYHPPVGFWNYFPDLKYVNADCKVYEVPLIVNYYFHPTSKNQWFGSAGVSSYFMKKEEYYYLSKDPSGRNSYDQYTVSNKNQHYFSSLRLSAGYEKKLRNHFSIVAEPYINIPLSGVGYGKVKLYSAGILFTVSKKPFAKK
jgi:hypothetical protein